MLKPCNFILFITFHCEHPQDELFPDHRIQQDRPSVPLDHPPQKAGDFQFQDEPSSRFDASGRVPFFTPNWGDAAAAPADATAGPIVTLTNTEYPAPFGNAFKTAKQQYLYLGRELTAMGLQAGLITELGFFVTAINGTSAYYNYSMKIRLIVGS